MIETKLLHLLESQSSHWHKEAAGGEDLPVLQVRKSVSGVHPFNEAPILSPPKQALPNQMTFLRQNISNGCSPKCVQIPLFLGATLTSYPSPAENRQKLRADELRREYHEEQRNEFENFVEEQNDGKSSSASVSREVGLRWKTTSCLYFSPHFRGEGKLYFHVYGSLEKKGESHKWT